MTARWPIRSLSALGVLLGLLLLSSHASALEELRNEKKAISACERHLCGMLVHKEAKGANLKCNLTKTWRRKAIKDAESGQLTWGFGDARCTIKLNVSRAEIVGAVTAREGRFQLAPQPVDCIVEENGEPKNVRVVVSPKLEFKDGQATKIWINLVSTDGPFAITSMVRFAVQLEDGLGLFHSALLKSVNNFIGKSCPEVLEKAKAEAIARAKVPKPVKKPEPAPEPASTPPAARAESPPPPASPSETPEPAQKPEPPAKEEPKPAPEKKTD